MKFPTSCDTFVCLPGSTKDGTVIFGKNSDRPSTEVQEIIYYPSKSYVQSDKVNCTYIQIDQVPETAAVILSKPSWMWGAEMGANSYGVAIGNEAVWGLINAEITKKLLGMDLVRLGLERGKSAREALDVITNLLEIHGQGGPCSNSFKDLTYHNSFLIADSKGAWVLETVGKYWAAEHVETGFRNISNSLSIGSKIDLMRTSLKEDAKDLGFWNPSTEFNFSKVFGDGDVCDRYTKGRRLLEKYSADNHADAPAMMAILRDRGINLGGYGLGSATTSSQVSVLESRDGTTGKLPCHWFTGTPDAVHSIFKPFIFVPEVSGHATNLTSGGNPSKGGDEKHQLYTLHETCYAQIRRNVPLQKRMQELESSLLADVERELGRTPKEMERNKNLALLFMEASMAELELYSELH